MVDLKVELHYPFQQHNIRFILVPVFSQERMNKNVAQFCARSIRFSWMDLRIF